MRLAAGMLLGHSARLVRPIGKGAMGTVWLAKHLTLECEVAVKVLSSEQLTLARRARFAREAKLAARIKSPYVVRIFDYGVSHRLPFIVMEKLDGRSLAEELRQDGRLPLQHVRSLGLQLCSALQQAHGLGVVHRDLKPHNVFLVDGHDHLFAKLVDFGIAKVFDNRVPTSVTRTGVMVGTPRYMSPEQLFNAKAVGAHADLWALAVTLYEALTGRPPFDARSVGRLWQQIDDARFPPPSELCPDVGPSIDTWFLQALRRDKERRFVDALQMADAWRSAFDGPDARPSHPSRSARPSRSSGPPNSVEPLTLDDALVLTAYTTDEGEPPRDGRAAPVPRERVSSRSWDDAQDDVSATTLAAVAPAAPAVEDSSGDDMTVSRPLSGDALRLMALPAGHTLIEDEPLFDGGLRGSSPPLSGSGMTLDDAEVLSVDTFEDGFAMGLRAVPDEWDDAAKPQDEPSPDEVTQDEAPHDEVGQGESAREEAPQDDPSLDEEAAGPAVQADTGRAADAGPAERSAERRTPERLARRYLLASVLVLATAVTLVWWPRLQLSPAPARLLSWGALPLPRTPAPVASTPPVTPASTPPEPETPSAPRSVVRWPAVPPPAIEPPAPSATTTSPRIDPCRQPMVTDERGVLIPRPGCLRP